MIGARSIRAGLFGLAAALGALALPMLPGCKPGSAVGPSVTASGAGSATAEGAVRTVDLEGLRSYLEGKRGTPILLNLWAMWCAPCVAELPHLQAAAKAHAKDGLEVVALNMELMAPGFTVEDVVADVPGFFEERGLDLECMVYSDEDVGPISDWFDVSIALPVTVVIRADGEIVRKHQGFASEEEFHEMAEQALGAPVEGR